MTFINLDSMEKKKIAPGIQVRFIHSENMTAAHWYFEKGAILPDHSHPHEQITTVISGKMDFKVGEDQQAMENTHTVVIPPESVHGGIALDESYIIDVFYPVREDYK